MIRVNSVKSSSNLNKYCEDFVEAKNLVHRLYKYFYLIITAFKCILAKQLTYVYVTKFVFITYNFIEQTKLKLQ